MMSPFQVLYCVAIILVLVFGAIRVMTWVHESWHEMRRTERGGYICIGCGCTDIHACWDMIGEPCHWLIYDHDTRTGVCSQCTRYLDAWAAGKREVV